MGNSLINRYAVKNRQVKNDCMGKKETFLIVFLMRAQADLDFSRLKKMRLHSGEL